MSQRVKNKKTNEQIVPQLGVRFLLLLVYKVRILVINVVLLALYPIQNGLFAPIISQSSQLGKSVDDVFLQQPA